MKSIIHWIVFITFCLFITYCFGVKNFTTDEWSMWGGNQQRTSYRNTSILAFKKKTCHGFAMSKLTRIYTNNSEWNNHWVQSTPLVAPNGDVIIHWLQTKQNNDTFSTMTENEFKNTSVNNNTTLALQVNIYTYATELRKKIRWIVPGNIKNTSTLYQNGQKALYHPYLIISFSVINETGFSSSSSSLLSTNNSSTLSTIVVTFNITDMSYIWHREFDCSGESSIIPYISEKGRFVAFMCSTGDAQGLHAMNQSTGVKIWDYKADIPSGQLPALTKVKQAIVFWTINNTLCDILPPNQEDKKNIQNNNNNNNNNNKKNEKKRVDNLRLAFVAINKNNGSVMWHFCPVHFSGINTTNIKGLTPPFIDHQLSMAVVALAPKYIVAIPIDTGPTLYNNTKITTSSNSIDEYRRTLEKRKERGEEKEIGKKGTHYRSNSIIMYSPSTWDIAIRTVITDIRGEGILVSDSDGLHVLIFNGTHFTEPGAFLLFSLESVPVADKNFFYIFRSESEFGSGDLLVYNYKNKSGREVCELSLENKVYVSFKDNLLIQPALGYGRLYHILQKDDNPHLALFQTPDDDDEGRVHWKVEYTVGLVFGSTILACICITLILGTLVILLSTQMRKFYASNDELRLLLDEHSGMSVNSNRNFYPEGEDSLASTLLEIAKSEKWFIEPSAISCSEIIGKGAFGTVWRANYKGTDVAVKLMTGYLPEYSDSDSYKALINDFTSEMQLLSKLRHPNIVLFMGGVVAPEQLGYGIVVEYCPLGSLFDLHERKHIHFDPETKLSMARDIARGMLFLHNNDPPIIHRDLKSPNILVTKDHSCKITDFGMSRFQPIGRPTEMTTTVGSLAWMAPELLRNDVYDYKIDIYSFGILLWEIIAREKPFLGFNQFILASEVLSGRRPDIPEGCSDTHPLIVLMCKCWSENAEDRPTWTDILSSLNTMEPLRYHTH